MPAPEQSTATEEGHLLTIRDGLTGRSMEADSTTANNILASVKEQVRTHFMLTLPLWNDVLAAVFMSPFILAFVSIYARWRLCRRLNCPVTHTFFMGSYWVVNFLCVKLYHKPCCGHSSSPVVRKKEVNFDLIWFDSCLPIKNNISELIKTVDIHASYSKSEIWKSAWST